MNIQHYTADGGREYHDQRASARSDSDQGQRASYFVGLSGPEDILLDFGCATGGIASRLNAKHRIGVEVSLVSAAEARTRLDEVHVSLVEVPSESVDVAMSFHAIEHVPSPLTILTELHRVLKPGGRLRLIVPSESIALNPNHRRWRDRDMDMHLFTWTPLTFGNLLSVAGFIVDDVRVSPWTGGGRVGRLLSGLPPLRALWLWGKALRAGRLQVVANAHKAS